MTTTAFPPIFDGHNDTLLRMHMAKPSQHRDFFIDTADLHIDLPKAKAGGLGGGFFATWVPNRKKETDLPKDKESYAVPLPPALHRTYATNFAMGMVARLLRLESESQGQVKIVRTADELATALETGVLAAIMHFEGAEAIDKKLDALHVFHAAGLRSLGPVWSRPTIFAQGVPFQFPGSPDMGPGLTDAGKALVKECNQLGIMVDLSHMNEQGFWDVAALTDVPLVATHSNAHALCTTPRNLTDKQLDAVAESGGVVGINYHTGFLRADGQGKEVTPLTEIVRHATYMVERMGIDHVALGSDFDGAAMPTDLVNAAGLPKLMAAFVEAGFDGADLAKIANGNWQRVLRATWKG
ncbi:MAG: dipeptidase [Caldilineaceae bacterium]|nr:dipeptidase [Caldilineaceae bacterium]MBP8121076.1 dipeptidase [Caldilineaceae bacterium]MBP9070807.1 dipeptidase [Caldilineaceae bacterium]